MNLMFAALSKKAFYDVLEEGDLENFSFVPLPCFTLTGFYVKEILRDLHFHTCLEDN